MLFHKSPEDILKLGDKKREKPLLEYLHNKDAALRAAAAAALSGITSDDAANALISALNDPDSSVVKAAAKSLGDMRYRISTEHLRHVINTTQDEELKQICHEAISAILANPRR